MAGAILISKQDAVSMNSMAFDHILEETRKHFSASEKEIVEMLYHRYDHEAQMHLSLVDAPAEVVKAFFRATAVAMASSARDFTDSPQNDWKELCEKLSRDPRMSALQGAS